MEVQETKNHMDHLTDWAIDNSIIHLLKEKKKTRRVNDYIVEYINEKQNRFFKTLEEWV